MIVWAEVMATTFAVLACVSWVQAARVRRQFATRDAVLLALWAAVTAAGHALLAVDGVRFNLVGVGLFMLGLLPVTVALAGMSRVVRLAGGLWPAAAEAVLIGSCAVAVLWSVVGPPASVNPPALGSVIITVVTASLTALFLRLPIASRALVVDGGLRRMLLTAGAAVLFFACSSSLAALFRLGHTVPMAVTALLSAAGYAAVAIVPWVGRSRAGLISRTGTGPRYLPALVVGMALSALLLRGLLTGFGRMELLLSVVIVASLVSVLVLALRENSALLADLEASRQRLAALVENASDVIVRVDADGVVVTANAATSRLLHRMPSSVVGRPLADVAAAPDHRRVHDTVLAVAAGRRTSAAVELALAPPATGTVELLLRGVPDGAVANLHDVTDAVRLRGRLERLARFDQMTGLANRAHLIDVIGSWLSGPGPVSVLYCDLDGFKAVNDRFGHMVGDSVLVEVAQRLRRVVGPERDSMVAGRIGGDEFVVALHGHGDGEVRALADAVVKAMRPAVTVVDRTVDLGVSVGIAARDDGVPCGSGPEGAADLLHRADLAMFAAKDQGRSHVARWDRELDQQAQRRVDIAIGLRRALDTSTLVLAYQPMVRLSDGTVVGMEALVRVPGGDRSPGALAGLDELVSPAELVEVAEDTGAIHEMGLWVLSEATRQAAYWRTLGHDVRVAVNMSVRQLVAGGFEESVARVLKASGLPAEQLILEITESRLVGETGPALAVLERLRALGVVLAIDDFGTGYSSLAYLRRLPVRVLKIDRTLLSGLGVDPRATTLVRAVVSMARSLGLLVVAEGLEDLATVRAVRDLGAFAGQGFAISPAISPEAMTALLDEAAVDLDAGSAEAKRLAI